MPASIYTPVNMPALAERPTICTSIRRKLVDQARGHRESRKATSSRASGIPPKPPQPYTRPTGSPLARVSHVFHLGHHCSETQPPVTGYNSPVYRGMATPTFSRRPVATHPFPTYPNPDHPGTDFLTTAGPSTLPTVRPSPPCEECEFLSHIYLNRRTHHPQRSTGSSPPARLLWVRPARHGLVRPDHSKSVSPRHRHRSTYTIS